MNNGSELELAISIMLGISLVLIAIGLIIFIKYFVYPVVKEKIIDNKYNDESNIIRFSYDYGFEDCNIRIVTFYKKYLKEYEESHPFDKIYFTSNDDPIGLNIVKKFLKEIKLELNYDNELYAYDYIDSRLYRMVLDRNDEDYVKFVEYDCSKDELIYMPSIENGLNTYIYTTINYRPMGTDAEYKTLMYMPHPLHVTHIFERDEIWQEFIKI